MLKEERRKDIIITISTNIGTCFVILCMMCDVPFICLFIFNIIQVCQIKPLVKNFLLSFLVYLRVFFENKTIVVKVHCKTVYLFIFYNDMFLMWKEITFL